MEELKMNIRQDKNAKQRWVYEWPMRKSKVKWPVRELMVKRQQRLLRRWLRYAENLRPIEGEEMVYICEPEIGDILNDKNDQRSLWDLIDCQEGSGEFPYGQMGKGTELGSSVDLKNCQEGREVEIPVFHEGNELRSVEDLKDLVIFQNPNPVSVSLNFQPNLNAKLSFITISAYVTAWCFSIYSAWCFIIYSQWCFSI
jgi:hypothetical protein